MSTLELRERIKRKIDSADEATLAQIDALLEQEFYSSEAYIEYRKQMPVDLEQAVLESEQAIQKGDVIPYEEAKKRFEEWRKNYKETHPR